MANNNKPLRVLFIGDVVGRAGRRALHLCISEIKKGGNINCIIANGENAAGGMGITPPIAREFFDSGVDVITTGNHVWQQKDVKEILEIEPRLLRPANFPEGVGLPGKGAGIYTITDGLPVGVLNLIGRVFIRNYDCPFRIGQREIEKMRKQTPIIIIDFHAETTSEKQAMLHFLDGQVSAIVGTHTHVQTADEHVTAKGTAFISDAGMTGPHDSVIGMKKDAAIESMLKQIPARFTAAKGNVRLSGVIIDIDPLTGKARTITRIQKALNEGDKE